MPLQNGGRNQGADLVLAAGPYGLGFPRLRDNSENLASFQDLPDRHTDRLPGNFRNLAKPALSDLLAAAGFIQFDDQEWLLGLEIRGRIVERQMPVFADANKRNVHLSQAQLFASTANHLVRFAFAVEQVIARYAHLVDQPVKKVSAKARRMRRRQADIFVQMKHLDVLPGNIGRCRERVEKFELRRSRCRDDPGAAEFLDRPSQRSRGMLGGRLPKRSLIVRDLDDHSVGPLSLRPSTLSVLAGQKLMYLSVTTRRDRIPRSPASTPQRPLIESCLLLRRGAPHLATSQSDPAAQ